MFALKYRDYVSICSNKWWTIFCIVGGVLYHYNNPYHYFMGVSLVLILLMGFASVNQSQIKVFEKYAEKELNSENKT